MSGNQSIGDSSVANTTSTQLQPLDLIEQLSSNGHLSTGVSIDHQPDLIETHNGSSELQESVQAGSDLVDAHSPPMHSSVIHSSAPSLRNTTDSNVAEVPSSQKSAQNESMVAQVNEELAQLILKDYDSNKGDSCASTDLLDSKHNIKDPGVTCKSDKEVPIDVDSKLQTSCSSSEVTSVSSPSSPVNLNQEYHVKWIKWNGNNIPIVTQNSNGPCPLLAIVNVLLLRKNICFPPMIEIVTASNLMEYLCDFILNNVPKNLSEAEKLNYNQNLQDALAIFPRLPTGLDVNVRFTGISDFEYTPECIIFDLLRIPLYHGWLIDPSHHEILQVVNNLSYNQLVDRIIANKSSTDSTVNNQMFIAEEFLKQSASQLTNFGLQQLVHRVKEEELCVLFRNNHFISLYKHKSKLYQLVTDQGFLTEPNVVWESLNNIEGNTYFVDGSFSLVPPKPLMHIQSPTIPVDKSATFVDTQQQIDQDYMIALSIQEEQRLELQRSTNNTSEVTNSNLSPSMPPMTDEELARKLQQEENEHYERLRNQQVSQSNANQPLITYAQTGRVGQQNPHRGQSHSTQLHTNRSSNEVERNSSGSNPNNNAESSDNARGGRSKTLNCTIS